MAYVQPELIYDQDGFRIRYLAGTGTTLVVSASGVGNKRNEEPPLEFYKTASDGGLNHVLFVTDMSRAWFNGADQEVALKDAIKQIESTNQIDRKVAIGNSMGGFMACVLAEHRIVDNALAITPQYSVKYDIVPEETRWNFFRMKIKTWPHARALSDAYTGRAITILHGDSELELAHGLRFPRIAPKRHFFFKNQGHLLARKLKIANHLEDIVHCAVRGEPWKLRRKITRAGGIDRSEFEKMLTDHSYAENLPV